MKDSATITVVGDSGVGKTSLILSLTKETFVPNPERCLEEKVLDRSATPDHVEIRLVDTVGFDENSTAPAELEKKEKLIAKLKKTSVICLVYSLEEADSFARCSSRWLPWIITDLSLSKIPIILVGNKIDTFPESDAKRDERLNTSIMPLMNKFPQVETCVECSAKTIQNVSEVFYYALKAAIHPTRPIYNVANQELNEDASRALERIFKISDKNRDGFLDDIELNEFQRTCFNKPLPDSELKQVKDVIKEGTKGAGLVQGKGVNEEGFKYLHRLFVQRGRMETTWTVLRTFGYDDQDGGKMGFNPDYLAPPAFREVGWGKLELSNQAFSYLYDWYQSFVRKYHGPENSGQRTDLDGKQLDELFSVSPDRNPWAPSDYKGQVETKGDSITANGFMAYWALFARDSPAKALKYLAHLGFNNLTNQPAVTFKQYGVRRRKASVRNVLVVGDVGSGKTEFVSQLIGAAPSKESSHIVASSDHPGPRTAQIVSLNSTDKILILQEVAVAFALSRLDQANDDLMVNADMVVLLYDLTSRRSFDFASKCAATLMNAPFPVIFLPTHGDADASAGERKQVEEEARKVMDTLKLSAPIPPIDARTVKQDVYKKICELVPDDEYLLMSDDRRQKIRRQKIKRRAIIGVVAGVAVTGVALLGRYLWKTYKATQQQS